MEDGGPINEELLVRDSLATSVSITMVGVVLVLAALGIRIGGTEQLLPPISFLLFGSIPLLGGVISWLYTKRTRRPFFL